MEWVRKFDSFNFPSMAAWRGKAHDKPWHFPFSGTVFKIHIADWDVYEDEELHKPHTLW